MTWRDWNPHLLVIAAGVFALACLVAGIIGLAHCDGPRTFVMNDQNLRVTEKILADFGHKITGLDGKIAMHETTTLMLMRGHNPEGQWFVAVLHFEGAWLEPPIRLYPIKAPATQPKEK